MVCGFLHCNGKNEGCSAEQRLWSLSEPIQIWPACNCRRVTLTNSGVSSLMKYMIRCLRYLPCHVTLYRYAPVPSWGQQLQGCSHLQLQTPMINIRQRNMWWRRPAVNTNYPSTHMPASCQLHQLHLVTTFLVKDVQHRSVSVHNKQRHLLGEQYEHAEEFCQLL